MIEGECKLESCKIFTGGELSKKFMKECFGIDIEQDYGEHCEYDTILRGSDESVEVRTAQEKKSDI